jgi:hypothetical protein
MLEQNLELIMHILKADVTVSQSQRKDIIAFLVNGKPPSPPAGPERAKNSQA